MGTVGGEMSWGKVEVEGSDLGAAVGGRGMLGILGEPGGGTAKDLAHGLGRSADPADLSGDMLWAPSTLELQWGLSAIPDWWDPLPTPITPLSVLGLLDPQEVHPLPSLDLSPHPVGGHNHGRSCLGDTHVGPFLHWLPPPWATREAR